MARAGCSGESKICDQLQDRPNDANVGADAFLFTGFG